MDGFNVLNEIASYRDLIPLVVLMAVISAIMLMVAVVAEWGEGSIGCIAVFLFTGAIAVAAFMHTTPTRYEITLKPGAVIDATRWDIVEQRGDIYVIQERKPNAD